MRFDLLLAYGILTVLVILISFTIYVIIRHFIDKNIKKPFYKKRLYFDFFKHKHLVFCNDATFLIVNNDKREIGLLFFKNLYGGWRVSFHNDTNKMESLINRGIINNIRQFNKIYNSYLKNQPKSNFKEFLLNY